MPSVCGQDFGLLASTFGGLIWLADAQTLDIRTIGGQSLASLVGAGAAAPRNVDELAAVVAAGDDREELLAAVRAVAADGGQRTVLHATSAPPGERRWFSTGIHRVDRDEGPLLLGRSTEITERRRAEQARERAQALLQATLEATDEGILVVDRARRWVNSTTKVGAIWGLDPVVGDDDRALVREAAAAARDPEGFVARVEEIYADPAMEANDIIELADGRILQRFTHPQQLGDEIVGRVWSIRDVTALYAAEREAQAARRRYEELVDSVDGVVWEADPDANFTFVSAQAERLLGYPVARWTERGFWTQHLHPADRSWAVARCAGEASAVRSHEFEYRMLAADGRTVWIHDLVSVTADEDGRPAKMRGVMLDITARKRAEAERDRLLVREHEAREAAEEAERRSAFLARAGEILSGSLDYQTTLGEVARLVLPQLADWCVIDVVDERGQLRRVAVTHVDDACADVAKALAEAQALEPRWPYWVATELRAGRPQLIAEITGDMLDRIAVDDESRSALEEMGCRSLVGAPLLARGRMLGIIVLVFGRSGRRYRAADLSLVRQLAERAALAVENASLYADARNAIRVRDEFLSVASHELRTPCTSLQLGVQSLLRLAERGELGRASPALVRTVLGTAERQSKRLAQLIDKLLDISRLRAGRLLLDVEAVDVAALTRDVVDGFREELQRSGSTVQVDAPGSVIGRWDGSRVSQVVTNLVSNAIKYGQGKPIDVSVRRDGALAKVVVRDRGIGIAYEKQDRIFGRFERAVSARNYGGLGLGLYIARQIANALGGDIEFQSTPGRGTQFTLTLPLAGPAGSYRGDAVSPEPAPPV